MNDKLKEFGELIEKNRDVYRSADVIITVLDDYVVGFSAIFLCRKLERDSEVLVSLPNLTVLREGWEVEEVFDRLNKDKLNLKNQEFKTHPFIWSNITNEDIRANEYIRVNSDSITDFREHKVLEYNGYISSPLSWPDLRDELKSKYGLKRLEDLLEKKLPYPSLARKITPMANPNIGPFLFAPFYIKLRRCGIESGKLKAFIELVGTHKEAKISVSPLDPPVKENLNLMEGEVVEAQKYDITGDLYRVEYKFPRDCNTLQFELVDRNFYDKAVLSFGIEPDYDNQIKRFKKDYPEIKIRKNRFIKWVKENSPFLFIFLIFLLFVSAIRLGVTDFSDIIQTFVVVLNAVLIYLVFVNSEQERKEREQDIAKETIEHLEHMKTQYEGCKSLVDNGKVERDLFNMLKYPEIPIRIQDFLKTETPSTLQHLRGILDSLSEFVLKLDRDTEENTSRKIEKAVKEIESEISRLTREYGLQEEENRQRIQITH